MRKFLPVIILIAISFLYTLPFFQKGFFPTHDGGWAIIRLAEMEREIKDFQIPPRWADYLNHGYGYPLFSFTYPAPYYIGLILRALDIGLVDSIKIVFVATVILSAIFMYLLGKELGGTFAGFISSVFYVVAPFRLVNLYIRGSIGESVSLAIFPLLFYLGIKYIQKPDKLRLVACSSALALLVLSHNIMALIFFPIWIAFLYIEVISYFEDARLYTWRYFLPMVMLGFGLCAFFFVPALLEKKFIILSQVKLADVTQNFVRLSDYLISPWNYGLKPSFQLGWAHILGTAVGFISIFFSSKIMKKKFGPIAVLLFIGISFLVFLMHPISSVIWKYPPLSLLDFPWRLLTPLAFFIALAKVFLSIHKKTKIIGMLLVIITVTLSLNFAKPMGFIDKGDDYYRTNDATTTSMDELMPVWVFDKPKNRYLTKVETEQGDASITNLEYNSRMIRFETSSRLPSVIKINTIYFPGWRFTIDSKRKSPDFSNPQGVMKLAVPSGSHKIKGVFSETKVRFWSNIVSVASFIIVFFLIVISLLDRLRAVLVNRQKA